MYRRFDTLHLFASIILLLLSTTIYNTLFEAVVLTNSLCPEIDDFGLNSPISTNSNSVSPAHLVSTEFAKFDS